YSFMNQQDIIDEIANGSYHALHLLHRNLLNLPGQKIIHHDLAILSMLAMNGPMLASELAEKLSSTRPQMTQFIDRLEKKGAVLRKSDTKDRRQVRVEITNNGRSTLSGYRGMVRSHITEKLEKLEPGQTEHLAQALRQVIEITQKLV
ncbi:MAG: MarR family transcriptional regulator, partial [Dehalococcoidales bacterium]|nr:MarR family transcriptional regulator [Dehalococcoidales bacterium]